jgi:hypothetical protein
VNERCLHQVLVVDTFAVAARGRPFEIDHYAIVVTYDPEQGTRRTFITRDESVFHEAMRLDVQQQRIAVQFHNGPGPASAHCCWLDAIKEEPC